MLSLWTTGWVRGKTKEVGGRNDGRYMGVAKGKTDLSKMTSHEMYMWPGERSRDLQITTLVHRVVTKEHTLTRMKS